MDFSSYTANEIGQIAKAMRIQEQKKDSSFYVPTTYDTMMQKVMIDKDIFNRVRSLNCGKGWFRSVCRQDKLHIEFSKNHYALPDTPQLIFPGTNGGTRSFLSPTEEQYEELLKCYGKEDSKFYNTLLVEKIKIAQENLKWLKENQITPKTSHVPDVALIPWTAYGDSSNDKDDSTKVVIPEKTESDIVDIHEFNLLKNSVENLSKQIIELQKIIKSIQDTDSTKEEEEVE